MSVDRCVCCGKTIPEGTQVCKACREGQYGNSIQMLVSLPAEDCNFKSALQKATACQIRIAVGCMEQRSEHDKSRIAACKRELRRRERNHGTE